MITEPPDETPEAKRLRLKFPYIMDETSEVARRFGATHTPEVFLFDGAGRLVYHGAVDDNAEDPAQVIDHYLRDALNALLDRQEIELPETQVVGCPIQHRE